jgi:hypothetical protein
MLPRRATSTLGCAIAVLALVSGCGGGSGSTGSTADSVASRPAPPKSAFPTAEGRTLGEIVKATEGPSELVVSPAALVFHPGVNRYPVGVFRPDRSQVNDAEIALYAARVPTPRPGGESRGAESGKQKKGELAQAREKALEQPAVGPFPAALESLSTMPAFRARTTAEDPDAATAIYTTDVDFKGKGEWRIAALIKQGGKTTTALLPSATVGEFEEVPKVGERAPLIHTPTAADVHGDLSKITTRVPPDTQNRVDYAEALGREPILLLFATPRFCQSRVCGPVVDVAEQVKHRYGDKAAFIHMEIYNDNDPSKGVRPQVRAFHLPSEPWLFAIDRRGVIRAEVEGAFGVDLMTRVVKDVIGE